MRRISSRYPRTSYGGGRLASPGRAAGLTRRALLGAAALVGVGGVVEALRPHAHRPAVAGNAQPHPAGTLGSHSGRHSTSAAGPAPRTSTRPAGSSHRAAGASPHPHHDAGHHGPASHHGRPGHHHAGHSGTHGHPSRRQHRQERVTLPPAKVRVRSRPIYSVADIDVHPPHKAIALTVDDGPDPDWTPKVLRLLDKHRMQASFCVVGIHADTYPGLIRDIHRAGHVIVNHSYTHVQPFAQQTEKRIVAEITRTQRAIERAAGVTPELFRSPGGDWSPFLFRAVAAYALTPLDWDVDPRDWAMPGRKQIERRMLRSRPGDIVLCHDGGGDRIETVRALRKVLPIWKRRGYTTIALQVPSSVNHATGSPSPSPTTSHSGPSGSSGGTPTP